MVDEPMLSHLFGRRRAHRVATTRTRSMRLVLVAAALVELGGACGRVTSQPSSALTTYAAPLTTTTAEAPPGSLPDTRRTPGETLPGVTAAEVCQPGWARWHRDVSEADRHAAFAAYGVPYVERESYELDHLIPLELGGDNALANLWPEPHDRAGFPGSHAKDAVENRLHEFVCAGRLGLATAQHAIATDWQTALGPSGS